MKGICIDPSNSTILETNKEYYLFPNGVNSFYVSNFDKATAHFGCFKATRFEVLENVETAQESDKSLSEVPKVVSNQEESLLQYEQMDLFDFVEEESEPVKDIVPIGVEVIIPENVVSPLECNHGLKTKAFKQVQTQWGSYVSAIQKYHRCDWFKARELLLSHRDSKEAILIERGVV